MSEKIRSDFVFMLEENFDIFIRTGIVGYECEVAPEFPRDNQFFIGVSRRFMVYGPFVKYGSVFRSEEDIGFKRLATASFESWQDSGDDSGWKFVPKVCVARLCPWRFRACAHPDLIRPAGRGCIAGIAMADLKQFTASLDQIWDELYACRLADSDFEALRTLLIRKTQAHNLSTPNRQLPY